MNFIMSVPLIIEGIVVAATVVAFVIIVVAAIPAVIVVAVDVAVIQRIEVAIDVVAVVVVAAVVGIISVVFVVDAVIVVVFHAAGIAVQLSLMKTLQTVNMKSVLSLSLVNDWAKLNRPVSNRPHEFIVLYLVMRDAIRIQTLSHLSVWIWKAPKIGFTFT